VFLSHVASYLSLENLDRLVHRIRRLVDQLDVRLKYILDILISDILVLDFLI
jgi:hypothetical protein